MERASVKWAGHLSSSNTCRSRGRCHPRSMEGIRLEEGFCSLTAHNGGQNTHFMHLKLSNRRAKEEGDSISDTSVRQDSFHQIRLSNLSAFVVNSLHLNREEVY